ncbi:hypothetical protein M0812_18418 [Anaeramoeba flamelloides]|uniref:Uncharacterized protein n=1 Tax=Anaeramoeba flamelloides TaxID=1746091 RepID=A0AAV7Z5U2_9EUKA|nr:hypothetical protein M0812_18418 [Anaeramoeba flamelloides]
MNQLQQTKSSPLPIRSNKIEQVTIRSQSACYFNRFSNPDLVVPQPKKNLVSKRFNMIKFSKYDFSEELSQLIFPIKGIIETNIEDKFETRFEQEEILGDMIQNSKNLRKEEKKSDKGNLNGNGNGNGTGTGGGNDQDQMLAFSPPIRTKCPLWQDNKFSMMLNLDNEFGEFENMF